jgi:hypothetical protein
MTVYENDDVNYLRAVDVIFNKDVQKRLGKGGWGGKGM